MKHRSKFRRKVFPTPPPAPITQKPANNIRACFSQAPDHVSALEYDYTEARCSKGYISWGVKNEYPAYLRGLYERCTHLQAIINTNVDFTIGDLITNNTTITGENMAGDTLSDVVRRTALDLWLYGGFTLQVFYNNLGDIHSVAYLDIARCRISEDYSTIYVIKDSLYNATEMLHFSTFGRLAKDERARIGTEVYYYRGARTKGYYPLPDYIGAIISAETQVQIKRYHFNNICNGLLSGTIVNINDASGLSDEEKSNINENIQRKFMGARGAGSVWTMFNDDKDHETTIQKVEDDNFDSKFQQLDNNTRDDIFISLRANQQLFGMAVNTGLQTQEFNELYAVHYRLNIRPKQNEIIRVFNKIFKGFYLPSEDAISITPYTLGISQEVVEQAQNIDAEGGAEE